ncbi:MAG: hypothetical protein ACLFVB_09760, partial [Thermoplasmata archaeon]
KESYSHAFDVQYYYSDINMEMVDENNNKIIVDMDMDGSEDEEEDLGTKVWSSLEEGTEEFAKYGGFGFAGVYLYESFKSDELQDPRDVSKWLLDNIKGALQRVWDGGKKLMGQIWTGMVDIYNKISQKLSAIKETVLNFIDWFVGMLEDVWDILGILAERVAYIAGLLSFVAMTAITSKMIKLSELGGDKS